MKLLLTIVTVTRNCVQTLPRTLESVRAIKRADVEYVVIDGASTDGTLELLQAQGELIDQLVSEPDTGIYNAMNKGVRLARGKWTLFINGDDELLPARFDEVLSALAALDAPGAKAAGVLCATTLTGSAQAPLEVLRATPWKLPFFNSIPHPSSFVRTALLRQYPFREDLRIVSDYDLFLRLFLARVPFSIVDVPAALHHRGGASGDQRKSQAELDQVRRERLGWRLPVFNTIQAGWRWTRQVSGRTR